MARTRTDDLLRTMTRDGREGEPIPFSRFSRALPPDLDTHEVQNLMDDLAARGIEILDDLGPGDELPEKKTAPSPHGGSRKKRPANYWVSISSGRKLPI